MKKKRALLSILLFAALFGFSDRGYGQSEAARKVVSGRVVDAATREPLLYAAVSSLDARTVSYTDQTGRFVLNYPPGDTEVFLRVSHVGYRDTTIAVGGGGELFVRLRQSADLPQVDVVAARIVNGNSGSIVSPSVPRLKNLPALGGETDVLKSLTLLPGISTGLEGTANLQIRGGNPSQTHILLDGVTLYNSNHLGGFLSSIDPYGVKNLTVYKGGVPARYGGRLSGVLDIDLREGRKDKHTEEFFIGTATLRAGREGPLGERGSYVASGRYSYPTLILNALGIGNYKKGTSGNRNVIGMQDLTLKAAWQYPNASLAAHVLLTGDNGTLQSETGFSVLRDAFGWSTQAAGLQYATQLRPELRWESGLVLSRYGYRFDYRETFIRDAAEVRTATRQRTALTDAALRSALRWYPGNALTLEFGGNAVVRQFRTRAGTTDGPGTLDPESTIDDRNRAAEVAAFGQGKLRLVDDRIQLNGGLRLVDYSATAGGLFWEPRTSLSARLFGDWYLNAGYDRHTQFVHQLTTDLALLPSDIWLLADPDIVPSRSEQVFVGIAGAFFNRTVRLTVEGFVKEMSDLAALKEPGVGIFSIPEDWKNTIAVGGSGRVRGLEFFLEKEGERLSGWLAYTYSRSERRYTDINRGNWYRYTFDRPHDGALVLEYNINERWFFSGAFIYQSGQMVTFPVAATADYFIYDGINNARVPDYHRLDVSFRKRWVNDKHPNRTHELILSAYNLYSNANPVDFRVEPRRETAVDPRTGQTVLIDPYRTVQTSLFPIVPSVGYKLTID